MMTDEELLEEAKRRYPIGTVVKCLSASKRDDPEEIKSELIWADGKIIQQHYPSTRVYRSWDKTWAEIISKPEDKPIPVFEVGKWYKFKPLGYDHFQIGKVEAIINDSLIMTPWLCNKDSFQDKGYFPLKQSTEVTELTDLSEIQQYLPEGHPDKITKEFTLPKSWCVEVSKEHQQMFSNWRDANTNSGTYQGAKGYLDYTGYWYPERPKNLVLITLEQFKKYVLKKTDNPKVEEKSLVGRYLKYIGNSKNNPKYGDFFRVDNMGSTGLFRINDKQAGCAWSPEKVLNGTSKSFELMPEGFHPDQSVPTAKYQIGNIVDTNDKGYQYTRMDGLSKNSEYTKKHIEGCNIKTDGKTDCTITNKCYSTYTECWWYETDKYNNWISEEGIEGLSKVKSDTIPVEIGNYKYDFEYESKSPCNEIASRSLTLEKSYDFKLKEEKNNLDTQVKNTYVTLPELKKKKQTIKF